MSKREGYATKGICTGCGVLYALRKDGKVRQHYEPSRWQGLVPLNAGICPGSGEAPKS